MNHRLLRHCVLFLVCGVALVLPARAVVPASARNAELIGSSMCGECEAPMVPMIIRGGGVVQICSRRGCKGHLLDLGGATID